METSKDHSGSSIPLHVIAQDQAESIHWPDRAQDQEPPVDTTTQEEEELNLFDILKEELSDLGEEDPIEEDQVDDLTGEDDLE